MSDKQQWQRAHEVVRLATTRPAPDMLLAALRDIRSISDDKKQRTLDQIGKAFAIACVARPTLAECREAIGITDAQPRSMSEFLAKPASQETVAAVAEFMLEALGCADEPRSGANAPPIDQSGRQTFTASSAEDERSASGRVETQSCIIVTERTSTFFPGDVNSPPWEHEYVSIEGQRRDGSCSIRIKLHMGDTQTSIVVDAQLDERDRILRELWPVFC